MSRGLATSMQPMPVSGGAMGGMTPIVTPLAASGFSPRALGLLADRLRPLGMAPMSGGAAPERIISEEGDRPLVPGSPLSIGMVTGDFDLSGIGTVTHVEGDRVYGFGHPMFSLGACELPMMTGYIHTVYPRASVSMKMGSPLKVVGVIDTDVSTSVAGRIGPKPDMLPLSVRVKTGHYADARTYHVQIVREPGLLPTLIMAVLTNAIDTEGNLPDELTAQLTATIRLKGHEPITLSDTFSGPRYTGQMGAVGAVQPAGVDREHPGPELDGARADRVDRLRRPDRAGPQGGRRSSRSGCSPTRSSRATTSRRIVTLKPYKGERETVEIALPIPADFPEGHCEATFCDASNSIRRTVPQRPRPARAARPGRASSRRSGSRPSPSGRRSTCTSRAGSRAVGPGAGPAQPAGQRPGGLRLEARGPGRSDPLGPGPGRADRLGRRGGRRRSGSRWSRTRACRYRCIDEPTD